MQIEISIKKKFFVEQVTKFCCCSNVKTKEMIQIQFSGLCKLIGTENFTRIFSLVSLMKRDRKTSRQNISKKVDNPMVSKKQQIFTIEKSTNM